MKVLFVEVKKKYAEQNIEKIAEKLPKEIHLLYTIQYKNLADRIKKHLLKQNFKILNFEQLIGCSKIKPLADILLIGSGKFHALQIALNTDKDVFIYDGKIRKIKKAEILKERKKEKAKILNFLASHVTGLIFSIKPGQNKLKEAEKIKKRLENKFKEKKFYFFVADTINTQDLENFSCFFINLACPGLRFDSNKIINYETVQAYIHNNHYRK